MYLLMPLDADLAAENRRACLLPLDARPRGATTHLAAAAPASMGVPPTWVLEAMWTLNVAAIVFRQLDEPARKAVMQLAPRWRDSLLHACVWQPQHWPDLSGKVRAEGDAACVLLVAAGTLARPGLRGPAAAVPAGATGGSRLMNIKVPSLTAPRR